MSAIFASNMAEDPTSATELAVAAGSLFVIGLLGVFSPIYLRGNAALFSFGNMVAAGVLLGAALCHQLADADDDFEKACSHTDFPWSYCLCGISFLVLLIIEEMAHMSFRVPTAQSSERLLRHQSCSKVKLLSADFTSKPVALGPSTVPCSQEKTTLAPLSNHEHPHEHFVERSAHVAVHEEKHEHVFAPGSNESFQPEKGHHHHGHHHSHTRSEPGGVEDDHGHHHHFSHIIQHLHGSVMSVVMLLLSLDIHSFLAGLSVGFSTEFDIGLIAGLGLHKLLAGFALGSHFCRAELSRARHIIYAATFCFSTPTGILVGGILESTDQNKENLLPFAIVKAVVAGTFLYISIMEIATKELLICREPHVTQRSEIRVEILKLFGLSFGFSAMSIVAIWV